MAKRTLRGTYLYRGKHYGPGEVDLPEGDEHKDFLTRLEKLEGVVQANTEAQIEVLLKELPAGHPYLTLFAARNTQPAPFDGEPMSNIVPPPPGVSTQPDGATVSGALSDAEDAPIMQPNVQALSHPRTGGVQSPRTIATDRERARMRSTESGKESTEGE